MVPNTYHTIHLPLNGNDRDETDSYFTESKWESYEQEQWYKPRDEQYQTQEIFTKQGGFYIFSKYRTLKSGLGR